MSVTIGIDIGTSYITGIGWILNDTGLDLKKCVSIRISTVVIYFSQINQMYGEQAQEYAHWYPLHAIYDIKKILGRKYSDPVTQKVKRYCPFIVDCGSDGMPVVMVACHHLKRVLSLPPLHVQGLLMLVIKGELQNRLEKTVDNAVVSIPAHFNGGQRQAIVEACNIIGLTVLKLINEPTAAALAYHIYHFPSVKENNSLLVFDMGSSLKVTIIIQEERFTYKIIATLNVELGGGDFDNRIIDYMVDDIRARYNAHFTQDLTFRRHMKFKAENAKISLSTADQVVLEDDDGDGKYVGVLTRNKFEELCSELLMRARSYLQEVLEKVRMQPQDVEHLVVAGGACKMPMIKMMLSEFFEREVSVLEICDTMVALGATMLAEMLMRQVANQLHDLLMIDGLPNSVRINNYGIM